MRHIPLEYRLCCECRHLIKLSAIGRLTYEDLCGLIDIVALNLSTYKKKTRFDNISDLEMSFLRLLSITPLNEIQMLKSKLNKFFYGL